LTLSNTVTESGFPHLEQLTVIFLGIDMISPHCFEIKKCAAEAAHEKRKLPLSPNKFPEMIGLPTQ
jgi:hypothetical protein